MQMRNGFLGDSLWRFWSSLGRGGSKFRRNSSNRNSFHYFIFAGGGKAKPPWMHRPEIINRIFFSFFKESYCSFAVTNAVENATAGGVEASETFFRWLTPSPISISMFSFFFFLFLFFWKLVSQNSKCFQRFKIGCLSSFSFFQSKSFSANGLQSPVLTSIALFLDPTTHLYTT